MNTMGFEKLSVEIESNCNDNPYVYFYDDERLCLDGNFTLEELRMIVSKWSEAIDSESTK